MIKISIDGKPVEAKEGMTVLKVAEEAHIHIPHLCYYPAFIPEGSCRLCLVEIEGNPKLEPACATGVREGMKIATQSAQVREARRSVLEFLLAEHPPDCPICDKAGECKLQDYYQDYGLTESVFREFKEKRDKKVQIGEKLILDRERCVLCTRCVRFLAEVTKTHELGIFERGLHAEISTYEENLVQSGYSGNLVDLCPVGAITDTEFRFKTRSWFLFKGESLCPLCSRGCNIYIDYHPGFPRVPGTAKVYRIRPRANDLVNGSWICDFGRYSYIPLQQKNRCEKLVWNKGEKKSGLSWEKAIRILAEKIRALHISKKTNKIALILSSWLTNEELFLIKKIFKDDLKVEKIFFADPKSGKEDGFLLRGVRSPNAKGAKEIGFEMKPAGLDALAGTEILIIFGHFLADLFSLTELKLAFETVETKVLVASQCSSLEELVDFVFPAAVIAEKSGSLTNEDGRLQTFAPVYAPDGDTRPEWAMLMDLAREMKVNAQYYNQFTRTGIILEQLAKDISFFRGRP